MTTDHSVTVVVHQVGRVGSTSLWRALQAHPSLDAELVGSAHRISDESYGWRVFGLACEGRRPGQETEWTRRVRGWVSGCEKGGTDRTLHVITPVRDPVARNLSKYFFERGRGMADAEPEIAGHTVDEAIRHFYYSVDHREPLRWFDEEVRGPLGIDVLRDHTGMDAYDPAAGHGVIEREADGGSPRVRMLLLDADMDDDRKASLVARFLGIEPFEIPRLNAVADPGVSADRDRDLYRRVLTEGRLLPEYLDWMYNSRFARRFFTPAQIEAMRGRWSCRDAGEGSSSGNDAAADANPPTAAA